MMKLPIISAYARRHFRTEITLHPRLDVAWPPGRALCWHGRYRACTIDPTQLS